MTERRDSDGCLLIPYSPCGDARNTPAHSVTGHFEVENSPLRINTLLFIGSKNRLKNYLLKEENVDLRKDAEFDSLFDGTSGLTFPCADLSGASFVVVWMPKFEWTLTDVETLSHECLHAAVMVMRMSGQKPRIFSTKDEERVDDEGLAYRQSSMLASMLSMLAAKQQRAYRRTLRRAAV